MSPNAEGRGSQPAPAMAPARRILIVEDDDGLRNLIARTLGKAGFEVAGAATGAEVIERIAADPSWVLLLDQKLPDMSGREILSSLSGRGLPVPFVMMTGQGDERLAVDMMKLGAADYLLKDTELIDRLPGVMDRVFRALATERNLHAAEAALRRSEERLAEINTCLSSLGADYEANVQRLTALCGSLLGAACALYNRLDKGMLCSVGQWHAPPGFNPKDTPEGHICYDVIRTGGREPLVIRNLPETGYAASDPNVGQFGLQSYMGHPVERGPEVIGSICAVFQSDFTPTADDRRVLALIASALSREEDRKRADEERQTLQDQLNQAQKMESVGRLAGGVAHDFNNMLGVILGFTEITLDSVPPGHPLHAGLSEIRKAAERSADLTRQLLAFARKQTIMPKVLDPNETVEGMLKMLRRLLGEHIELIWRPGKELGKIRVDPSQIDQILVNLCVNARDAIEGTGAITIATDKVVFDEEACAWHAGATPGEFIKLTVCDTGHGMDAETLSHIFEPFFTTKKTGEGTGLGLATVYGIVRQNNGFVDVQSTPGKGSTFDIYLPRHLAQGSSASKEASTMAPLEPGHATILLVEDEPAMLNMTRAMLERRGYKVLAAASPGEALQLAESLPGGIHLLMTDVIMPEMNGRDLAQRLFRLQPGIKCLFMSGYTAEAIVPREMNNPDVGFIQKPFSMKDMVAKIAETLGGGGQ